MILAVLLVSTAIWLVLLFGRAGFWTGAVRDTNALPDPASWPAVTAIIPARDEADMIGPVIASLAAQDYRGAFSIVLVDDQSSDGTADVARAAAANAGRAELLTIVTGRGPEPGWTGKVHAQHQGFLATAAKPTPYVWLTDADIAYAPDTLSSLVRRAEAGGLVLTSLMAKLRCESFAERALIPAFIFFFQMLYPFARVNAPRDGMAGAAGGCMLARRAALDAIGGFAAIRSALIDDCTLGAKLKTQGPIWLGLTERARSLRPYPAIADIGRMVSRSAYAQLGFSPLALAGTLVGMALVYLAGPAAAVFAEGLERWLGLGLWAMMTLMFAPTVRFYRLSPLWSAALPAIAFAYLWFTLESAVQFYRGRGGMWKGRAQAALGK